MMELRLNSPLIHKLDGLDAFPNPLLDEGKRLAIYYTEGHRELATKMLYCLYKCNPKLLRYPVVKIETPRWTVRNTMAENIYIHLTDIHFLRHSKYNFRRANPENASQIFTGEPDEICRILRYTFRYEHHISSEFEWLDN